MGTDSSKRILPVLLIAAILILEMATDIYAPSLPEMAMYFAEDANTVVMTISSYLLAFSIPGVVVGPLSDSIGRRPLFLLGSVIFCAASFTAWLSPTIQLLILSRFCQGLGAGIFYVLSPAIIKDSFPETACSRIFSSIGTVVAMSPMVAPIIGAMIANYYGWSTNFALIALIALAIATVCFFRLPESLDPNHRAPFSWRMIFRNYKQLILQPNIFGFALISGIAFGGLWAWIASAPFFFIDIYGMSPIDYSYYAAAGPFAYIMGTIFNRIFVERLGVDRLFNMGLAIMTSGSVALFVVIRFLELSLATIYLPLVIYAFGLAPVFANATTRAVNVAPNQRGVASAILCTSEMLGASFGAFIVSLFDNGTLGPTSLVILISVIICNAIYYFLNYRFKDSSILTSQ